MDDLDFSIQPEPPRPAAPKQKAAEALPYDAKQVRAFFEIAGEPETFTAGKQIFQEQDKPGGLFSRGAKVYLLLEGQIALNLKGKPLHLVLPGEIFGELALISDIPRSATAVCLKPARVLALDEKRFLASLQKSPEFSLMLVSSMLQRLRMGIERLSNASNKPLPPREAGLGLDAATLQELRKALGDPAPNRMAPGDVIVSQGAVGVFMFLVNEGQVAITLHGQLVETLGPGEIFGEAALLGPTPRAATATAQAEGSWLQITRPQFLQMVQKSPATGIALLRSLSARLQHVGQLLSR